MSVHTKAELGHKKVRRFLLHSSLKMIEYGVDSETG
jgi:hypothetical protein